MVLCLLHTLVFAECKPLEDPGLLRSPTLLEESAAPQWNRKALRPTASNDLGREDRMSSFWLLEPVLPVWLSEAQVFALFLPLLVLSFLAEAFSSLHLKMLHLRFVALEALGDAERSSVHVLLETVLVKSSLSFSAVPALPFVKSFQ